MTHGKRIRILFFIKNLSGGGAEKALVNLLYRLDPLKYEITVQTIFDQGLYIKDLPPYVRYRTSIKKEFKGFAFLTKLFSPAFLFKFLIKDASGFDIIVPYYEGVATRIASGCPDKKVKLLTLLHLEFKERKVYLKPYRSAAELERVYNRFDHVCAVSQTALDSLKRSIALKVPACVIHNVVETDKIVELAKEEVPEVKAEDGALVLGSVGRLFYQKGYVRLMRVLHRLKMEGYQFRFYIVGTGPQQKLLEKAIKKFGLADAVFLLGFHVNPYKFIKRFDLFVCSSHFEGYSTVVCESLILGTPVLSTLCSGMEEILGVRNEYGIIVENSETGLYGGIKSILDDPDILKAYQQKALERAEIFSAHKTASSLDRLLEEVVGS